MKIEEAPRVANAHEKGQVPSVGCGALLGVLEEMVKNGTERSGEAVVLMYDEEDGFWISTVDCGCRHHPIKDIEGTKRKTLGDAIDAAMTEEKP